MKLDNVIKPGMKGVFYGRHSTDKQEMDMQRQSVQDFAQKYRCSIIKEYLDKGVSATKVALDEREQIQQLLQDLNDKQYDFVIVYNSDRLARDPLEHLKIRMEMRLRNIPIVVSSSETLYDSDEYLVQLMQDGFSKFEVDNIKERTYKGLEAAAKQGRFTGGKAPFGYRYLKERKAFEPVQEELTMVKEIFTLYKQGDGFYSIAQKLPHGTNKSKEWTKEKVKTIITNPFYAGFISWRKRSNTSKSTLNDRELWILAPADYIKPIISPEEWELCWRMYNERRKGKVPPKQLKTSFLLNGILQCKSCKQIMKTKNQTTTNSSGKKYGKSIYFCSSCKLTIESDPFHEQIKNEILFEIRTQTPTDIYQSVQESLDVEVQGLKQEIKQLEDALGQYSITKNQVKTQLKQLMEANDEKRLIEIVTNYHQHLNQRIEQTKSLILTKQKSIQQKQNIEFNREAWSNVLDNVLASRDDIEPMDLRRLYLALIEFVLIDQKMNVQFQLRIDREKKQLSNQARLIF